MIGFPVQISKTTLHHRGGTKSYHLTFIKSAGVEALCVQRWGKTGSFGQMKVDKGTRNIIDIYNSKIKEKERGGYEVENSQTFTAATLDELKRLVTIPVWTKLGADNIKFILPEVDPIGVKDPEEVEFVEGKDGRFTLKEKPPLPIVQTIEEKVAANPKWGMF